MPTRNVNLTEHLDEFIEPGIRSGRFRNASEIVREGLHLLEQREEEERAKIEWLRTAAKDAVGELERGESIEFASIDDLVAHIESIGAAVSAEVRAERECG